MADFLVPRVRKVPQVRRDNKRILNKRLVAVSLGLKVASIPACLKNYAVACMCMQHLLEILVITKMGRIYFSQESITLTGGINSTYIQFLTKPKAFSQIFKRALAGERKNRFVQEDK